MSRSLSRAAALLVLAAACSVQPAPQLTPSQPADLAAMNGNWIGEYTNSETGRSGSIAMSLRSWSDSAAGDLVLVPNGSAPLLAIDVAGHVARGVSAEVLRLSFKPVSGGMVEATVEPYFSSDCTCAVTMVLQATPEKNLIAGEFVLSSTRGLRQQGKWSVSRQMIASR